jgi:TIR domain
MGEVADGLRLFLNHRRSDAVGQAHRLHELLVLQPGTDRVFIDVGGIEPGTDFAAVIDAALADTDVVLAVIGETWLAATDGGGRRRLDDPDDFVRKELERALDLDLPIIPVLVGRATMPTREDLPATLGDLTGHQAFDELRGERWLDTVRGPRSRGDHPGSDRRPVRRRRQDLASPGCPRTGREVGACAAGRSRALGAGPGGVLGGGRGVARRNGEQAAG